MGNRRGYCVVEFFMRHHCIPRVPLGSELQYYFLNSRKKYPSLNFQRGDFLVLCHTRAMDRKLALTSATLGIGIFLLNAFASVFYIYISTPWFDMLMHALGGVFIAITTAALLAKRLYSKHERFIVLLLTVFIIGLGWEYYEYLVQFVIKSVDLAKIPDSVSDLICDMIGGTLGATFVILARKRYNTTQ